MNFLTNLHLQDLHDHVVCSHLIPITVQNKYSDRSLPPYRSCCNQCKNQMLASDSDQSDSLSIYILGECEVYIYIPRLALQSMRRTQWSCFDMEENRGVNSTTNVVPDQILHVIESSGGSRGGRNRHPLKLDRLCAFYPLYVIRMLKNKAQRARESIKTILELPGPLSRPWTPAESGFGSALVMCVRAHNLLRPLNVNPGSAPGKWPDLHHKGGHSSLMTVGRFHVPSQSPKGEGWGGGALKRDWSRKMGAPLLS